MKKEDIINLVKEDGLTYYYYLDEVMKNDEDVIVEAIKSNPIIAKLLSDEVISDEYKLGSIIRKLHGGK